eukprot:scaffold17210_cov29-Prasinocladus_malaysianus.AAC.1
MSPLSQLYFLKEDILFTFRCHTGRGSGAPCVWRQCRRGRAAQVCAQVASGPGPHAGRVCRGFHIRP